MIAVVSLVIKRNPAYISVIVAKVLIGMRFYGTGMWVLCYFCVLIIGTMFKSGLFSTRYSPSIYLKYRSTKVHSSALFLKDFLKFLIMIYVPNGIVVIQI
jgi:hypothetical protein